MYPNAQILPLDYDPDVSFANIENRLQMLVMNAKQEILEENEERDRRRSHHYMESDKKTYRRKKYGVEKNFWCIKYRIKLLNFVKYAIIHFRLFKK